MFLRHGLLRTISVQSAVCMFGFMVTYCRDWGIQNRKCWKDVDSTGECCAGNRSQGLSPFSERLVSRFTCTSFLVRGPP